MRDMIRFRVIMTVCGLGFVEQATLLAGRACPNNSEAADVFSLLQTHLEVQRPNQLMPPGGVHVSSAVKDHAGFAHLTQQQQRSASNITKITSRADPYVTRINNNARPLASKTPAVVGTHRVQSLMCCAIVVAAIGGMLAIEKMLAPEKRPSSIFEELPKAKEVTTSETSKTSSRSPTNKSSAAAGTFQKKALPWQSAAKPYYKYIFPGFLLTLFSSLLFSLPLMESSGGFLEGPPKYYLAAGFVSQLLWTLYCVVNRCWELRDGMSPASRPEFTDRPFNHVVIICAFKEPLEVLRRTLASIVAQEGTSMKPMIVLAMEEADSSRHATYASLNEEFGSLCKEMVMTEHLLSPEEVAGKGSNENFSVREIHRELVEGRGLDPFTVMLTIADADSIFAPAYLSRVEDKFWDMQDGRRMVYNGPLNVYRNLGSTNLVNQFYDIVRCHIDTFKLHHLPYTPHSNYSLTLGFAAELAFWTPDNFSEDQQTRIKAMANNFGSWTTVFVPSFICNDLVEGVADRWTQAKRNQWGSVESLGYLMALRSVIERRAWLRLWATEFVEGGCFKCYFALVTPLLLGLMLYFNGFIVAIQLTCVYQVCDWVIFWGAEAYLWNKIIKKQFPVESPSVCSWISMVSLSPLLDCMARGVYMVMATVYCMFLAMFQDTMVYVTAPKGTESERARVEELAREALAAAKKQFPIQRPSVGNSTNEQKDAEYQHVERVTLEKTDADC